MRIRWRGLELPSRMTKDADTATATYAKFVIEPFERGFGSTIGNSLRRVLLSSLEGAAVCSLRIAGVSHEFSSIPGVIEDVTDICLNVKGLIVKHHGTGPRTLRVDRHSRGVITGADIVCDDQVEILNPELVIATLTDDVPFSAEFGVEIGRGFTTASERFAAGVEVGVIALDACFSPVVRVRHAVEETRVGQKTNFDRLVIEVWTDGTVSPEMSIVEAAKILRKHLGVFVGSRDGLGESSADGGLRGMSEATGYAPVDLELEEKLGMSLAELNLSVRATNCLESEGIGSVRELVSRTEDQLLQVRNFGETTLTEVRERLTGIGLRLGMRVPKGSKGAR